MNLNPVSQLPSPFYPQPVASQAAPADVNDCRQAVLESHKNQLSGNIPVFLSILTLPFDCLYTAACYIRAKALGDREGELDAGLRLTGMPFNAISSIFGCTSSVFQIKDALGIVSIYYLPSILMKLTNAAGLVVCGVESFFEMRGLERQMDFLSNLKSGFIQIIKHILSIENPLLKEIYLIQLQGILKEKHIGFLPPQFFDTLQKLKASLQHPENASEVSKLSTQLLEEAETAFCLFDLQTLKRTYLELTSREKEKIRRIASANIGPLNSKDSEEKYHLLCEKTLKAKISMLARRVQPSYAQEVRANLAPILEKLRSKNPELQSQGKEEAKELLSLAKVQAKKQLLIHVVSLVGLAISASAFMMLIGTGHFIIPLTLLVIGGTFGSVSYLLNLGWLNTRGWTFSTSDCLPGFVKAGYSKVKGCVFSVIERADRTKKQMGSFLDRQIELAPSASLKRSYSSMQ